jgi:hypothetical protein
MVSSVTNGPSLTGAATLGLDPRLTRTNAGAGRREEAGAALGDQLSVTDAASWAAARESVRAGAEQVDAALEIGAAAQALLARIVELAKNHAEDPEGAEAQLAAELKGFAEKIDEALADGQRLVRGDKLQIHAEAGAPPIEIEGLDLRLGAEPGAVFSFTIDASFGDDPAALVRAVEQSRAQLTASLQRLGEAARGLAAHQGFLGALSDAGVRADLDADAARLLALQVRQDLEGLSGASIANAEPSAVLGLFRA